MAESTNARMLYVDAGDIADDRVDFDGLNVLDPEGRKLGDVDGFIVQRETNRPYYLVVDSGGWFSSRRFLVPIGHARLDAGNNALRVDLDKNTIERFPEFDEDRFPQLSEDEVRLFNERTLNACCATELQGRTGSDRYDYDKWSHYAQPDWWEPGWFKSPSSRTGGVRSTTRAVPGTIDYDIPPASPATSPRERELVTARERDLDRTDDVDVVRSGDRVADEDRPFDRAQPGDVLGIERDGETTELGDTPRAERDRLVDAEEDAAKLRRDELKDRDRDRDRNR